MSKYEDLSKEQLVELLEKRDRTKKLGLVWERDEIEADKAIDENFVAATLIEDLSDKPAPWGNLVIEGDNFDALRWLRMTYAGRIKCIYVDPPYNTGNKDWVYNDNYVDKEDRFRYSMWLEFLFQRFMLARELLAEDGVILVSINDENRALMELMLDETLPGMRKGTFVWRTRTGGNDTKGSFLSENHEHILIYGNDSFKFSGTLKSFDLYKNWDEKKKDWYRTGGDLTKAHNRFQRPNTYYPLHDPKSDIWYPCNPDAVWRYSSIEKVQDVSRLRTQPMEKFIEDGYIHFPTDQRVEVWNSSEELLGAIESGEVPSSGRAALLRKDTPDLDFWIGKSVGFGTPSLKRYKLELKNPTQPISSWVTPNFESNFREDSDSHEIVVGTNIEAAKEIKNVFGSKSFDYAKPVSLLREVLRQSASHDDIVLDFFAGSATSAQAVMELNAEDGGDRSFIMVSSTEATQEEPDKNLCRDVTAERIRLLNASEDKKYAELAAEFAYLRTREIDFENIDYDLQPQEAWNALEAIHGLPLTYYDDAQAWNEHCTDTQALVYVDQVNDAVFERIEALSSTGLGVSVYSWSPGQLRDRLAGTNVELQSVRSTLVKRFQQ